MCFVLLCQNDISHIKKKTFDLSNQDTAKVAGSSLSNLTDQEVLVRAFVNLVNVTG